MSNRDANPPKKDTTTSSSRQSLPKGVAPRTETEQQGSYGDLSWMPSSSNGQTPAPSIDRARPSSSKLKKKIPKTSHAQEGYKGYVGTGMWDLKETSEDTGKGTSTNRQAGDEQFEDVDLHSEDERDFDMANDDELNEDPVEVKVGGRGSKEAESGEKDAVVLSKHSRMPEEGMQ